jgi:hypothetical protein
VAQARNEGLWLGSVAALVLTGGCATLPGDARSEPVRLTRMADIDQHLGRQVVVTGLAGATKLGAHVGTGFYSFHLPQHWWPEAVFGTRVEVSGVLGYVPPREVVENAEPVTGPPPWQSFYTIHVDQWQDLK